MAARVRRDRPAGPAGQPVKVVPGGGLEGDPSEAGATAPADHQARGARPPPAQQQHLRGPVGDGEAEVGQEPLGPVQVRLLELQPCQARHLDQRVAGPPGVLVGQRPYLAVQRTVRVLLRRLGRRVSTHRGSPSVAQLSELISIVIYYQS